jgi:hypothetical protein
VASDDASRDVALEAARYVVDITAALKAGRGA